MKRFFQALLIIVFAVFLTTPAFAIDASYNADRMYNIDGWHVVAADDDLSNSAATLITELDTTFAQLAAEDSLEFVSASSADTTQYLTVTGIISNGQRVSETNILTGTTAVTSGNTWRYVESAELDAECAGAITIRRATGDTFIVSIPIGQLNAQVSQHFNGTKRSFVTYWSCGVNTTTANVTFTLRWYPDDADCLDPTDGFRVLDTIFIDGAATSPYNAVREYAQPIECPAGGWIAVYAIGSADDGDGYTTLQGYDVN